MTTLYFAYGANLNLQGMRRRCPGSRPLKAFELLGFKLVFRGVADVVPSEGDSVLGALYRITHADELALDRFEGYRHSAPRLGHYRKEYFTVRSRGDGNHHRVMYYTMNGGALCGPSDTYFNTILQGYQDWELDSARLYAAAGRLEVPLGRE